jgi:glutamine cyclotransferase
VKIANPVFGVRRARGAVMLVAALALSGCSKDGQSAPSVPPVSAAASRGDVARYSYEVVAAWPHDRSAFTQGLVFHRGNLIESTGMNGESSLREVEMQTGRVLKQVRLAQVYFGEGVAVLGDRAYQLTWQNRKGFVYDADTFRLQREFPYEGEGWGLTTDGRSLILSDGTERIRFLDPETLAVSRTLTVTRNGQPQRQLNELEFIRGEIFANVWMTDEVVRIDPATGAVRGVIDFSGLLATHERVPGHTDVLNGIAYDPATDRLLVTGKRWPKVYQVRLKPSS